MLIPLFTFIFANAIEETKKSYLNRWEFRTAPLAMIAHWYTLDVSYRTSESFSFGPAVVVYGASEQGNMFLPSYKGSAIGGQTNYYFGSVKKNSWYLGTHIYFEKYNSYPHALNGFNENIGYRLNTTLGYKIKNAGILSQFGIGIEYRDHSITRYDDSKSTSESREANLVPVLELKMGFEI